MSNQDVKTLLLVEDEAIIALAEKRQLESVGYLVIHSQSGEKALDLVCTRKERVDLILMDINLGMGLDGTETAQRILMTINIPILFLSSHTEKEIVEKTESITNYGYVVKNSSITVLDASIKMAFKLFDASENIREQQVALTAANEKVTLINENLQKSETELIQSEAFVRNKLRAILEPEGSIGNLELADIIDSQSIQSLMEDFYQLTGILGAILDRKGNVLVAAGWQDICTKFHRCNPTTAQHCKESDISLTIGVEEGTFKLYRCKNNMWDMVTPLVIDNCHVGNVFIGQFIFDDEQPDIELFRAQAKRYGFDEVAYMEAFERVPRFSRKTVETGMTFYAKVASMISTLSYSSLKLARAITERKNAEAEIRVLLAEKELVLKEVHHRIKNNLMNIQSMLAFQSEAQTSDASRDALIDASSRIKGMTVLYDKLYQTDSYQNVYMQEYLPVLVKEIIDIFPKKCDIQVVTSVEDVLLNVEVASTISIIVNELITNSIKYAFPGRRQGLIRVASTVRGTAIKLVYEDDGVGIPDTVTFDTSSGFGMRLIRALVEQLHGSIRIERGAGTRFLIEFDIMGPSKERR